VAHRGAHDRGVQARSLDADRDGEPPALTDAPRVRYRSLVADSARWDGFALRPGDVVISTPPKCGTTWTQMLCALLVFDSPDFPAPLEELSPWLDMLNQPLDAVRARLAAQTHRRFIKTHTPLDGVPLRPEVTYVVVGRDPRDVAVSLEHHVANMDWDHFVALRTAVTGSDGRDEFAPPVLAADPAERLRAFVRDELPGRPTLGPLLHHLETAWDRRHDANVVLVHYADLTADLTGEMLRLAAALGIPLAASRAAELAREAGLERMRARAAELAPAASQENWRDVAAFFRKGGFGKWRSRMTDADAAEYAARVAALVPPELAAWTHLGRIASGIDPRA
jgi:aryl sulfotransferase